jgi:hypothetical protein
LMAALLPVPAAVHAATAVSADQVVSYTPGDVP